MNAIPYNVGEAVTKSDTVDIPGGPTDAVYFGAAGTCTAVWENGTTQALTVVAGDILPLRVKRFNNTGTAVSIVALYHR